MQKQRSIIKNRHNLSIVVEAYQPENPTELVFIQHGLSGYKEELHIQAMRDVFYQNNYMVVTFDSTHSFGESDGTLEQFTATSHRHDLEDIISWASDQEFYQEPFVLCGHSMGGFSVLHYLKDYPEKVKAIAPISTGISGSLVDESWEKRDPEIYSQWLEDGRIEKSSSKNPSVKGYISREWIKDFCTYNMLDMAEKISVPVIMIVGGKDLSTPYEHQKLFYDLLACNKEMHVIKDAPHSFKNAQELDSLTSHLDSWIKKLPTKNKGEHHAVSLA